MDDAQNMPNESSNCWVPKLYLYVQWACSCIDSVMIYSQKCLFICLLTWTLYMLEIQDNLQRIIWMYHCTQMLRCVSLIDDAQNMPNESSNCWVPKLYLYVQWACSCINSVMIYSQKCLFICLLTWTLYMLEIQDNLQRIIWMYHCTQMLRCVSLIDDAQNMPNESSNCWVPKLYLYVQWACSCINSVMIYSQKVCSYVYSREHYTC